jgi:chromosome segregation ATPase
MCFFQNQKVIFSEKSGPVQNPFGGKMIRKIGFLLLFILLVSAVCVQAEDVKIKSHGRVRVKAKNARLAGREENVAEAHPDLKTTAEFQEIDDLSKDIRQTLTSLQKDIEKILAGIRSVAMRKSTIEAEKQTIEMLSVQSDAKEQSITTLSGEIKTLAKQVEDLSVLYRRKDSEFKTLSAKLNELGIKRKGLSEFRTVAGSFNNVDADSIAVNLSANNDDVTSLHKRIDDVLSGATAAKAVEEKRADVRVTSDSLTGLNSMPKWILDKIREKGKKMETSYGDMVVVKEGGTTIISIKKENDAKFRGAYEKFIKESYEGDGMEYFVLAAGS